MTIINVHELKVPEFIVQGIYHGDVTEFNEYEEEVLGKAIKHFNNLCMDNEFYIISKYNISNKEYIAVDDILEEKCIVCDIKVIVYKK